MSIYLQIKKRANYARFLGYLSSTQCHWLTLVGIGLHTKQLIL